MHSGFKTEQQGWPEHTVLHVDCLREEMRPVYVNHGAECLWHTGESSMRMVTIPRAEGTLGHVREGGLELWECLRVSRRGEKAELGKRPRRASGVPGSHR